MKVELNQIKVRDLVDGYKDSNEEGVVGYGGKLDIRPKYQREFIYKSEQRDAVLRSVLGKFPINVMYWVKNEDGTFEILDGQQRTVSICQYVAGDFSIKYRDHSLGFPNLTDEEQEQILNYELMVYFCEGNDKEKLDWFEVINTAGEKLNSQELRNAVYAGPWTIEAKRYFSKTGCPAYQIAEKYINGSTIRQDYLETTISWLSGGKIEEYMSAHQHDQNANELWFYFQKVIQWVQTTFTNYRSPMKGIEWGVLYNQFKDQKYDPDKLEIEIADLVMDDEVTKKSGIYEYILARDEKYLNLRAFTDKQKLEAYERQKGICVKCGKHFELNEMEADHIKPWTEGGKTSAENCQLLCKDDNRRKGKI